MEIKDYLKVIGGRIWIPLLVPALAGGVAAGLLSRQPAVFVARGNAVLSGVVEGANETKQFVAEFRGAVSSAAVVKSVSQALDVPEGEIAGHIGTKEVGSSSIISLTFSTNSRPEKAPEVLEAAATKALEIVLASQVAVAEQTLEAARGAYDEAQSRVEAFNVETQLAQPAEAYENAQTELTQLRLRFEDARARGETAVAASFGRAVTERQALVAQLGPQVERQEDLIEARAGAFDAVSEAEQAMISARGRLEAITSGLVVTVSDRPVLVAGVGPIRQVLAVGGAALLGSIALILVLEALVGPPRRKAWSTRP